MKYLIRRASCSIRDWNEILEETDLDIKTLYDKYGDFIVMQNDWWYEKDIENISSYCRVSKERAKQISECELVITIYDDYIE